MVALDRRLWVWAPVEASIGSAVALQLLAEVQEAPLALVDPSS